MPISAIQQSDLVMQYMHYFMGVLYMCVCTHTHTHTYNFSSWSIPGDWIWFLVLCGRTLLSIHSKCNSLHLLSEVPRTFHSPPHSLIVATLNSEMVVVKKSLLLGISLWISRLSCQCCSLGHCCGSGLIPSMNFFVL